jgi:phage gp29-like protein
MGNSNDTGSYARSNTQLQFTQLVFDGILEEIANCLQKQIINPIVEWNFGDINLAPTISFDKFTTGDLQTLFNILNPLMQNGTLDSENKAVQDSIALLFKKETGLQYTNEEEVEMPEEDFGYQEPVSGETLTDDILQNLDDDLNAESG